MARTVAQKRKTVSKAPGGLDRLTQQAAAWLLGITPRALDVLASADILAAEDTRTLRHLMEIHGVALGTRHWLPITTTLVMRCGHGFCGRTASPLWS